MKTLQTNGWLAQNYMNEMFFLRTHTNLIIEYFKDLHPSFSERNLYIMLDWFNTTKTLKEVGLKYGMSADRVRQIATKGLRMSKWCVKRYNEKNNT